MTNRKRIIAVLNVVSVLLIVIIALSLAKFSRVSRNEYGDKRAYPITEGWKLYSDTLSDMEIILPDRISGEGNSYFEIRNTLPSDTVFGDYLFIRSSQQEVYAYIDGQQVLAYDTSGERAFGKTSVRTWLEIPLDNSYAGKEIRIRFTSVYDEYRGILNNVYFGERQEIMGILVSKYWMTPVLAFVFFILGIAAMIIYLFLSRTSARMCTLQYLSVFLLDISVWMGCENMLIQFIYNNPFLLNMLTFVALAFLPVPILMYIDEIEKQRYNNVFIALISVDLANVFIQFLLAANNIYDFLDMLAVTHVLMGISAAVALCTMVMCRKHDDSNHKIAFFIKAVSIFVGFTLAEAFIFYLNPQIGKVGFLMGIGGILFCVMLIYSDTRDMIEIEKQREQAVDANNAKTQFLAKISHELRTPINIIVGMDDLIMDEEINHNTREYALNIKTQAHTILTLVNDLLDVSKMESGRMNIVPIQYDVHKLIRDTGEVFRQKAMEKGIKFNLRLGNDIPRLLYGDSTRIQQIMINLLSNAVKYTHNGHIDFAVTCHNEDDRCELVIAIADTGIGIDEKYLPHVFDTFSRANNPNIEGSGLGLSIAKQLVDLMDGKIEVESVISEGSCFTVTIPQKIIQNEDGSSAKSKVDELADYIRNTYSDKRVLVVDDNALNLQIIKTFLKNVSVASDCVLGGNDCLRACSKKKYDIILMDHMMPELDGIETLKRLRADSENINQKTKVVALTANAMEGLREKYLARGFDEYLPKPVDKQVIYELIIRLFEAE